MPRQKSNVWEYFERGGEVEGTHNILCNYCRIKFKRPNATKMREHLLKCINVPLDIRTLFSVSGSTHSSLNGTLAATLSTQISTQETPEQPSETSLQPSETSWLTSASTSSAQNKKRKRLVPRHEPLKLARNLFNKPENEYQTMARNWTFKLERMAADQRRLAEKFINEILFEGEEGNLERHSVTINSTDQYFIRTSPSPAEYIQSPLSHTQSPPQSPSPTHLKSSIDLN